MNYLALFTQLALGLVLAATTSWLTVHLTLRRTKKETLWQKRFHEYAKILDALHACRIKIDNDYSERLRQHKYEWNNQKPYEPSAEQKEKIVALKKEYDSARSELERIRTTGRLILPEEVTQHLAEAMRPRYDDWKHMDILEFLDAEELLLKDCVNKIIVVARGDLR